MNIFIDTLYNRIMLIWDMYMDGSHVGKFAFSWYLFIITQKVPYHVQFITKNFVKNMAGNGSIRSKNSGNQMCMNHDESNIDMIVRDGFYDTFDHITQLHICVLAWALQISG